MQFFSDAFWWLLVFIFVFSRDFTISVNGKILPPQYLLGDVAINCGCLTNSTALDGRHWVGETPLLRPVGKSRTSISAQRLLTADPTPYLTARISSTHFSFMFQVNPGQKFIRLHFYPNSCQGFEYSQDFFTVIANSFTLLQNFSASLTAHALGLKYVVKEFCLNVNETGQLHITFFPSQSSSKISTNIHAFVNGIEIISMPTGLYYTLDDNLGARVVGQDNHFYYVDNSSALELIHRLNVGRGSISPLDDNGMFRRWSEDADYLLESGFQQVNHLLHAVEYIKVPQFIAPPKIYLTSRKLRKNLELEEKRHFTWKLPVDLGFGYILRLHLCSLEIDGAEGNQEGFDILVQNLVAQTKVNVIQLSGGYGIPVYRDYMVMMKGDKAEGKRDLFISVHSVGEVGVAVLKGLEIFKLSNPDNSLASPNPSCSKSASPFWTLKIQKFLVAFGKLNIMMTALTIILAIVNIAVYKVKQTCDCTFWQEEVQSAPDEPSCRHFSLAEIFSATQDFNDALVIGKGGFGKVYKGFLHGRPELLAIKRLKPDSKQGAHEFWREIDTLSKLRHIHLVSLIGYCNEREEMILVYEYMPRGTIADNLYKASKNGKEGIPLTWEQRLKICIGAARGLDYLHTGTEHGVIHRDVKDTNILLDENLVAKISDFGLSKLGRTGETQDQPSSKIKGTVGYLDPDYIMTHKPSTKSDIYAFGIVLLVVLSGRPAVETIFLGETVSLLACFRECMRKGEMNDVIDPCLQGQFSTESLSKFIKTVEKCLHRHPRKRPTMAQVVVHLEHALDRQQGRVPSVRGEETVLSQPFPARSNQPFDFYELQVAPVPEESILSPSRGGNSSKEIEKADLSTKVEVFESREKDRNITSKPLWGRPWVALRGIRKPSKKKEWALRTTHIFSLKDIKSATQNFSNDFLIGQGGLCNVYKGFISGLSEVVAIKRWMSYSTLGVPVFRAEVELLSKLHYIHLVSFVGFCNESNELILVCEYMSQGTLANHLYRTKGNRKNVISLTWEQRLRICISAARGLNYLHEVGIIHRDVTDRCIMLDEQLVPKISCFRMSKLSYVGQSESHVSTEVVGSPGYLDPHYFLTCELTKASDVYSFGIVLLVVLSGRPVHDLSLPEEQKYLKSWYEKCIAEGNVVKIVDLALVGKIPPKSLRKFTHLITKCLLEDRKLRPSMAQVVAYLEEILELAQNPLDCLESDPALSGST